MLSTPPLLPISLTLCSLGMVLALVSADAGPHVPIDWGRVVEGEVSKYLPKNAVACGVLKLGSDYVDARRCVEAAKREGRAFWTVSQAQGEDSSVWLLVAGDENSFREIDFDSYGWQQRGSPSFTSHEVPCKALHFGQVVRHEGLDYREPAISCEAL